MSSLKVDYSIEKTKRDNSLAEYNDILKIVKQLKDTHAISEKDEKLFSDLIQKVESVFKSQEKAVINLSTPNTQCAADVLKAHIAGNRV
jgi:ATP phosphoribosyltransferase